MGTSKTLGKSQEKDPQQVEFFKFFKPVVSQKTSGQLFLHSRAMNLSGMVIILAWNKIYYTCESLLWHIVSIGEISGPIKIYSIKKCFIKCYYNAVFSFLIKLTEAVSWRCLVKKVFSKILQKSQENVCIGVSVLIKLQRDSGANHMRETGSLRLTYTLQKTSQVWKYFFHYLTEKCVCLINELKTDQK